MRQAARRKVAENVVHEELGTIVDRGIEGLRVRTEAGLFVAKRAVSCLVEPEVDDKVLVAVPSEGPLYVLAVLERESEAVRLKVDGPLTIETEDRLELKGKTEVAIETKRLDLAAGSAKLALGAVEMIARVADVNVEVAKLVASAVDVVSDRLMARAKRSYRFIEEMDVTRAKDVDLRAEQTLHMRSKNTVQSAEQLYKVDAEQIHLG
jgi:hypothetical protein